MRTYFTIHQTTVNPVVQLRRSYRLGEPAATPHAHVINLSPDLPIPHNRFTEQ